MRQSKADKAKTAEVDRHFRERCRNKQIPIMDISKVMEAGRQAQAQGLDIGEAMSKVIETVCKNPIA